MTDYKHLGRQIQAYIDGRDHRCNRREKGVWSNKKTGSVLPPNADNRIWRWLRQPAEAA